MGTSWALVLALTVAACGKIAAEPDAAPPCPPGLTACGGTCVSTGSDNLHCGECDNACETGFACTASECRLTCQTGLVACGTRCVDPATDAMHCGASGDCIGANAGEMCGVGEICDGSGTCAATCLPGLVSCGGSCIDPATNETYCGASGSCQGGQAGTTCGPQQTCTNSVCTTPPVQKRVFVTSAVYTGNLGGLAGADALCQNHADQAGLAGVYLAWLADSVSAPATRFTQSAMPYVLVNGTLIASNYQDLIDGALLVPIQLTETGGPPPIGNTQCAGGGFPTVWTSVNPNGTRFMLPPNDYTCLGWTSSALGGAEFGRADDTTAWWTTWCTAGSPSCGWTSSLYCFQQ